MSDIIESITKKRCQAMREAGIENPDSADGILFCAGNKDTESRCPYPYCVVFEHSSYAGVAEARERKKLARLLRDRGVSKKDIALILNKNISTVYGYLKRR